MTATEPHVQLADHGRKPRNMGRLGAADAVGNVGSIVVGRALRFFIKIDEERITEAKFQVFACPEMVPSTSVLTELVVGRTIDEALALGPDDICEALGGLDRFELPMRPWGLAALADAIRRHRGDDSQIDGAGRRVTICRCHGVDEVAIQAAIADGCDTVDALVERTKAGTGCGSCRRDVEALLQAEQAGPAPVAAPSGGAIAGRIGTMKKIEAALAPVLEQAGEAGGTVELWDFAENNVLVKLGGNLADDGPERRGVLERIDRALKDDVDPLLSVTPIA